MNSADRGSVIKNKLLSILSNDSLTIIHDYVGWSLTGNRKQKNMLRVEYERVDCNILEGHKFDFCWEDLDFIFPSMLLSLTEKNLLQYKIIGV